MTYLAAFVSVSQHLLLYPITILLSWFVILLAPILHLGHYVLHALMMPLRLLGNFETLYIYFGVAAVVGIVTGSVLHLSTSFLVTALGLQPVSQNEDSFAISLSATRRKKRAQRLATSLANFKQRPKIDASRDRDYTEWLENDGGKRKNGLLSTTILEEDDDFEGGFY